MKNGVQELFMAVYDGNEFHAGVGLIHDTLSSPGLLQDWICMVRGTQTNGLWSE
jgi:hypothetical protein